MASQHGNVNWTQLLLSGLLSAVIAAGVSLYNTHRQMELATKYEQIKLFRELVKEFYGGNPVMAKLRGAIESCKPLYRAWGGSFSHDEINVYLGFFEDLGYFLKQGTITLDMVDHLFGGYIIEAFEHPEIGKYIDSLKRGMQDPGAFSEFEGLARNLEKNPKRDRQVQDARNACKETKRNK